MYNTDFMGEKVISGKTYVTVNTHNKADEASYKTIVYSRPGFVPPITFSEENGEQMFSYDVTADRFLRLSMLPSAMSPVEFLTMMKNITDAVVGCADYFMNPFNFLLSEDYIYLNPGNFDVRLIYVPFNDSLGGEKDIGSQIFRISRRFAKTTGDDWHTVITRLWNMSESTSVYDANEIFTALHTEYSSNGAPSFKSKESKAAPVIQANEIPAAPPKPQTDLVSSGAVPPPEPQPSPASRGGLFGFGKKAEKQKKQPAFLPAAAENDRMQSEVSPDSKTLPAFEQAAPKPLIQNQGGGVTQPPAGIFAPRNDSGDDGITQPPLGYRTQSLSSARFDYCGAPSGDGQVMPQTIRAEFQNGVFTIGRVKNGKNVCDFAFPPNTRGVSHVHARITKKGARYFITDLNTQFGTYVDFQKIAPMAETELFGGEKVSISAGIDYIFVIEKDR